jgi:hypothetical protein
MIRTSASYLDEIRRGEALKVGDSWYRVGSAIGSGAAGEQIQRAAAPASVTTGSTEGNCGICDLPLPHRV